ncbi:transposable element tc3 transposase [Trichonephila inaurata madagascariensis]|uniref:Transposable element tc3 transposase n=1 Tax=Trichonephila inaurata madagascariensis TaxID=2747483 RepID=A0A8X6WMB9_9ARAC|nr:transposable element tc3 transposase [Trichonephila inaurata madagascariensis]
MNNSKTNQDTKIQFAPNGWKRNRVLCGKEKNSNVGDQQMALSEICCRIMQNNKRYEKEQLPQGMRDSKGPKTSFLLKKMKKLEATGSLSSRQRSGRPSTAPAVAMALEQTVQSMSAIVAHGECSAQEVSRQTGVSYGSAWRALGI